MEEALCVSGEEVRLPPQQECTAPFIAKSFVTQRRRDYAPFIFKWAAKSFGLTSHQGFLNRNGCCNQSGISSPFYTFHWDMDWPDEIHHRLWRKKEVHSPFGDSSGGFELYIYFSILSLSGCILFCIDSIRSVTCVACKKNRLQGCYLHKLTYEICG